MATFAVTTAQNIDELTSKAGSDTYNINGGYLTVDQDSRFGLNNSTSSVMGNITLSATLGGTIEFNATKVRLIPYDSGSGNVPAYNTAITQGGATGKLIGVISALNAAPTAPGAAMPASGYIKIKQWNDVAYAAGALGGITANATGADIVGWIEIVADENASRAITCVRLGTFKVRGEWFDLGTTDGNRATTYQTPTNGQTAVYLPGCWVETAPGSDVYEFYPCAGSLAATAANLATDSTRGKYCWVQASTGLIRFGHDGTNSTGGYVPESGCKVRIPNIMFNNCATAGLTVNVVPNATIATRPEFVTTSAGVIDIDKCSMNWYLNCSQPFSVTLSNFATFGTIVLSECASPITWEQVGVGQEAAVSGFALNASLNFAGGTMTDCVFSRATLGSSGNYVATITDLSGFDFTNCKFLGMVARGNATTGSVTLIRLSDSNFIGCTFGDGRVLMTTCSDLTFTDSIYYDHPSLNTIATNPMYLYDLSTVCTDILMDGVTFPVAYTQPYNGVMNVGSAACKRIKLRNLGTYASPLDLGGPREDDVAWSRSGTTATVTKNNHGLATGMSVYVVVSDVVAAIVVGLKTITVTGANTFTFTCLNAGATSGTLCYFPTVCANLFVLASAAAAQDVRIQRCYAPHTRTNLYTADNSSKDIVLETVFSDYLNAFLTPQLNGILRAVSGTPVNTAQAACYGTHWFNYWNYDNPDDKTNLSWSRVTTTCTVVAAGHNLRTGAQINVWDCDQQTPVPLGLKTVTVLTSSIFTFACTNSGATSGTLSFEPLIARIGMLMNEATEDTADVYTIDSGNPTFTSAGTLYMPTVGDQITFIHPVYIKGVTGYPIAEVVMAGGTLTNHELTYAIDKNDGDGFSSFKNLSYPRAGAGGSNGSTTITMTSTTGVAVDDYVFGTNVGGNAKVVSIDSPTAITVDKANTGTVSGILRFNAIPNETGLDAELGMKLKVRIRTSTANVAAISSFYLFPMSTYLSRDAEYPLDVVPLTLTGLQNPSEVRVFDAGTTTEVADSGAESVTSGTHTVDIDASTYPFVDVVVLSLGYQNIRYLNQEIGSGLTIPVSQQIDRQYSN